MDTPAETPVSELADRAVELMKQGGSLWLDSGPGFPLESQHYSGNVTKELAARIADRKAARAHAMTLEQTSLFVDSEPLAKGVMNVAAFLRGLAGDQG